MFYLSSRQLEGIELFPVWVILNKVAVHLRTGHCTDVFISVG